METGLLFETRAGPLRLRWNERGLTAIEMPELPPRALRAELAKQNGTQAPPFVREAARLLERHLAGEAQDLAALPLDLSLLAPFQRAVYDKVRDLPPGRTATYGEIAALLGKPGASRAVGQALGRNPFLVAVPCHRVLAAGGAPGGFSAPGGVIAKQRLLALEGVTLAVDHGLPFDPVAAVEHLRGRDRRLAKLIDRVGPFRLRPAELQSPFEALLESIVYQQLTGRAAATILARVIGLFRPRRFPRPQDVAGIAEEKLRGAGLSRSKAAALKDLAAKTLDGTVPASARALEKLSDAEIVERLTAVRGIGPWTVEMLLIFRLARPDVLPATDYGVRKGFARVRRARELPSPKELLAHGERWRPYRTVASWYLWRVLDL
ncbi:MAG: methylated-DNA--[protein]-cysteine S-methyltransferase [Deltaproteobacteria bacterium]|nr:MAG: methylated-DNA--[protein]-cysteine S-methyltransferase [Deltaproteobacteria bacterium]